MTMITTASGLFGALALLAAVFLRRVFLTASRFWWGEMGQRPVVRFRSDSTFGTEVLPFCSTLTERYTPPFLWGSNPHLQTAYNHFVGKYFLPIPHHEERVSLTTQDGTTVTYDFYQPPVKRNDNTASSSTMFLVCPGIGNSSESHYIRSFVNYIVNSGHSVAILNHVGAPKDVPITGCRIFTYGGTGDLATVFKHLLSRYPTSQFVLVGFSLGANIAVRFIGERVGWRKHFICAISVCQGYDPTQAIGIFPSISNLSKLYGGRIISEQLSLMRRHRSNLIGETPINHLRNPSNRNSDITHNGHDCNGFSLDPSKIIEPQESLIWAATSINEMDEYYTRRIMGFSSVRELWRWMSCVDLLNSVTDFPLLLINSCDDPVIPSEVHSIPLQYTDANPYAMFVTTEYGGHLGFFENGIVFPNKATWLERLVLQYSNACRELRSKTMT